VILAEFKAESRRELCA